MSISVSQIISDCKYYLNESGLTTAEMLRLINLGRREIVKESMCLQDIASASSSVNVHTYTMSATQYKVYALAFGKGDSKNRMLPITTDNIINFNTTAVSDRHQYYKENTDGSRTLEFYPASHQFPDL